MPSQKNLLCASGALAICLTPLISQAEQATPQIVVTANRTANTVDETLAPVQIITKEDMKRTQAKSVIDVLKGTPGVDFTANGGLGSRQSIHLRGTNSNHVLVLIDGVPAGSATLGTTPFQYIPIAQVERIEIVRGPHSSLYGSSAIGGVIQIFTNKGQAGQHIFANAGYGSDNTTEVNTGISGGNQTSTYNMSIGYTESDGYNFLGETPPDTDDDGFDNTSLSLGGSHQFNDQFKLSGTFLYSDGRSEYDSSASKDTHFNYKEQVASIVADYDVSKIWSTQFAIGQSIDDLKDRPGGASSNSRFKTTKENFSWKNELLIREADLLTLGIDYLDESVDGTTDYDQDSRWNQAAFAQYQYYGDVFDIKLAWRYDDNEAFGSHNTESITLGFDLDQYVRVTTSYGTAFNAPTFNSLYFPQTSYPAFYFAYEGNPDLKPEESESFDFGLSGQFNSVTWNAHYYQTKVSNLIATEYSFNTSTFFVEGHPENVNKANIDGLELSLATELWDWTVQTHLSYTNPTDDETGEVLDNRSKQQFRLDVDQTRGKFSYGASVIASSKRYFNGEKSISGYGIMNIRAAWELSPHWTLKAKIDNLFDKEYATDSSFGGQPYYRAPDRFVFASIHYQM